MYQQFVLISLLMKSTTVLAEFVFELLYGENFDTVIFLLPFAGTLGLTMSNKMLGSANSLSLRLFAVLLRAPLHITTHTEGVVETSFLRRTILRG